MTLGVVLSAHIVPEKVPEVHPSHLVIGEEAKVFTLAWHHVFQGLVQATFCLQCGANVILVAGLVGPLCAASKRIFLDALFLAQTSDIAFAVGQPFVQLVHDVPRQTRTHLGVGQRGRIHLPCFWIAYREQVLGLHPEVLLKAQAVICEQTAQDALEFRFAHLT